MLALLTALLPQEIVKNASRLGVGLSQQLDERVGVTRQTINAIEQEKYSPTRELAFRFALEFQLEFIDVFSFDRCQSRHY